MRSLVIRSMNLYQRIGIATSVILLFLSFFACKKDQISSDPNFKLSFSTDTLTFDTLISTRLSATLRMKVYNRNDDAVKISSVSLDAGANSIFRINVSGRSGTVLKDLEVKSNDSLWLFVDVNLPVGSSNLPFEINEKLSFITNGNVQQIVLNAWGQNAIFHRPISGDTLVLGHSEIWDGTLPHVIYGVLKVDSGSTLTLQNGCKTYFHQGASLVLISGCRLIASGDASNPVIFQGDRLEQKYKETAGQWGGIVFKNGSGGHELSNVMIKGASSGIIGEGKSLGVEPQLSASNLIIKHCLNYGLVGRNSSWEVFNLSIYDCGADALRVEKGGNYQIYHATLFSSTSSSAQGSTNHALTLRNWFFDGGVAVGQDLELFELHNSIIWSNAAEALSLSDEGANFNYTFDHCLFKTKVSPNANFQNCFFNQSPNFVDNRGIAVLLGENSAAINVGNSSVVNAFLTDLGQDLKDENRLNDGKPDLGAYEFSSVWIE